MTNKRNSHTYIKSRLQSRLHHMMHPDLYLDTWAPSNLMPPYTKTATAGKAMQLMFWKTRIYKKRNVCHLSSRQTEKNPIEFRCVFSTGLCLGVDKTGWVWSGVKSTRAGCKKTGLRRLSGHEIWRRCRPDGSADLYHRALLILLPLIPWKRQMWDRELHLLNRSRAFWWYYVSPYIDQSNWMIEVNEMNMWGERSEIKNN